MKIAHIIPEASIFGPIIQRFANDLGHDCVFYRIKNNRWKSVKEFFSLYLECKKKTDRLFVFHSVPHYWIIAISLLLRDFHYCLLYWGGDFYSTFLDEVEFEQHCIKKSSLINKRYYRNYQKKQHVKFLSDFRRFVGLKVVSRAEAVISLTPKSFRFLKYFYFKIFRTPLETPHFITRAYAQDPILEFLYNFNKEKNDSLTVLICHSATESVAHEQSLEIIKRYKEKWGVRINVYGFLSYSGGDEFYRDSLEKKLKTQACFADSIFFERKFLNAEEIQNRLLSIDIAVFSCFRDEGVGLLTHFVKIGGVVCFNKFSINYDFFKYFSPGKLLSHEQLINMSPKQLYNIRVLPVKPPPRLLQYNDFENIEIRQKYIR